jgi:hypothetical protein
LCRLANIVCISGRIHPNVSRDQTHSRNDVITISQEFGWVRCFFHFPRESLLWLFLLLGFPAVDWAGGFAWRGARSQADFMPSSDSLPSSFTSSVAMASWIWSDYIVSLSPEKSPGSGDIDRGSSSRIDLCPWYVKIDDDSCQIASSHLTKTGLNQSSKALCIIAISLQSFMGQNARFVDCLIRKLQDSLIATWNQAEWCHESFRKREKWPGSVIYWGIPLGGSSNPDRPASFCAMSSGRSGDCSRSLIFSLLSLLRAAES